MRHLAATAERWAVLLLLQFATCFILVMTVFPRGHVLVEEAPCASGLSHLHIQGYIYITYRLYYIRLFVLLL